LVDRYWVKLEDFDIRCVCKDKHCIDNTMCKEYLVKLLEIDRQDNSMDDWDKSINKLFTTIKKETDELSKSIKKLKGFKL